MKTEITIDMDNEAFADAPGDELSRILRNLANEMRRGGDWIDVGDDGNGHRALIDANGNTVGFATLYS